MSIEKELGLFSIGALTDLLDVKILVEVTYTVMQSLLSRGNLICSLMLPFYVIWASRLKSNNPNLKMHLEMMHENPVFFCSRAN